MKKLTKKKFIYILIPILLLLILFLLLWFIYFHSLNYFGWLPQKDIVKCDELSSQQIDDLIEGLELNLNDESELLKIKRTNYQDDYIIYDLSIKINGSISDFEEENKNVLELCNNFDSKGQIVHLYFKSYVNNKYDINSENIDERYLAKIINAFETNLIK